MKEIRVHVPEPVLEKLELIEKKYKLRKEDLIMKAILQVIEMYLGEEAYEVRG